MSHLHDPAAKFLEEHGENIRRGNELQIKNQATDLADSAVQIDRRSSSRKGGINLRKVAEVLTEYGMDPTVEILNVLPELDPDLKAKVMLDLLQYCQPKLKSVEMRVDGTVTSMTPAEREARLIELQKKVFVSED